MLFGIFEKEAFVRPFARWSLPTGFDYSYHEFQKYRSAVVKLEPVLKCSRIEAFYALGLFH
jgi:hypothetical protein